MRLRENGSLCSLVAVSIKTDTFISYSHQKKLTRSTDCTSEIFEGIKQAFIECWKGENIRQLGVRLTKLSSNEYRQENLFDYAASEKQVKLDTTIDALRKRYGKDSIVRSIFINSGVKAIEGGTGSHSDYPMMGSIL